MKLRPSFYAQGAARHKNEVKTRDLVLAESEVFANQTLHEVTLEGLAKVLFAHNESESGGSQIRSPREEDKRTLCETVIGFGKDPLKVAGFPDSA